MRELIADLCPAGVEFKALGEIGEFTRGNGLQKRDFVQAGFPCIHYGQIYTFYGTSATDTKAFVSPELAARLRRANPGDLVIATTSENDEDVCKAMAWMGSGEVAVSGDAYVYAHTLDPLYAAYFFQSDDFQSQKRRYISGTKVKRVSGAHLSRVRIPVPPVEVQREIAKILKTFEELEAELEVELEARRRQHEHYRSSMLSFAGEVMWSPLGTVLERVIDHRGKTPKKLGGDWALTGHRVISALNIKNGKVDENDHHYVDEEIYSKWMQVPLAIGDVLLTSEAPLGAVAFIDREVDWALGQRLYALRPNRNKLDGRFLYHLLAGGPPRKDLFSRSTGSTVSGIRQTELVKVEVPLPPLAEQRRIASALDLFDVLVNDLSSGLPAEITARRRQFEYYRDQLFSFKEKAA